MKKTVGYYVAYLISTVFHPILIIPFFLLVVLSVNPFALGAKRDPVLLSNILLFAVFFPGLAVVIMKLAGMISSTNLKKTKRSYWALYREHCILYLVISESPKSGQGR